MIELRKYLFMMAFVLWSAALYAQDETIKVTKIWEQAPHNAFTDLIHFKGKFYCTFREGDRHVHGKDGQIRILVSSDGKSWESLALLSTEGYDLRDSKLSVSPKGGLMVLMGGSKYVKGVLINRLTHVSMSDKQGKTFSAPVPVQIDEKIRSQWDWLWRVTWNEGIGYGVLYRKENSVGSQAFLVSTKDGLNYDLVYALDVFGLPGEATVLMDGKNAMQILLRLDGETQNGLLGTSTFPFSSWNWKDLGMKLGGPHLIRTGNGTLIAGTRSFPDVKNPKKNVTSLFEVSKTGTLIKNLVLPSGGDNSYPGIVERNGILYVSYYSSHEGKSAIYFAEVPLIKITNK